MENRKKIIVWPTQKPSAGVVVKAANDIFEETIISTDRTFLNSPPDTKTFIQNLSYELFKLMPPDRTYFEEPNDINTDLIEMLITFDYQSLDKLLKKNEICTSSPSKDCGLCVLQQRVRKTIHDCNRGFIEENHCPIAAVGIKYLTLKKLKPDLVKLHLYECKCTRCFQAVGGYNDFLGELGVHEKLHGVTLR